MAIEIREVWAANLDEEFKLIGDIVDEYPYVALDTEFPGEVDKSRGSLWNPDHQYSKIKNNVNRLKLIQLGLTFSDEHGRLPICQRSNRSCVWQFNFCDFDPEEDENDAESIAMLRKAGIDLERNHSEGVESVKFVQQLMSSGALMNDNVEVTWLVFAGGYDFGYLLRMLRGEVLPEKREDFFEAMNTYFQKVYDLRHMIQKVRGWCAKLDTEAEVVEVKRAAGVSHQAGSDSLLTSLCFFKRIQMEAYRNSLPLFVAALSGLVE